MTSCMNTTDQSISQSIIDNMHAALVVIGEHLEVICINPAAEMMFHISNNRARGRNLRELVINEHEFFDRLERSLVSAHPYSVYEDQLLLHNQQHIDVDYSVSPIPLSTGKRYLLIEFKLLNHLLKHSHEDSILNQYEASKGLLRGLAHEIKNPLGGIRGAAQLLQRELGDENNQFTQIIIQETDRLKDLLDRMVGPKDIPNKGETNIHKLLEHVRKLVKAEHPDVTIVADYDPSIPEVFLDESMMVQVLLNLTRNSVTATKDQPDRDNVIHFRTRSQRNCKIGKKTFPLALRIEIEDNGAGIDPSLKEKIFLPMVTGHADGTGLGLPIAQSLVKLHDGLIEFDSQPESTVFTILLPLDGKRG